MNIIIYTVIILTIFYLFLKFITNISSKKISKGLRLMIILGLVILAILFAIGGRYLLTLPLTLASVALLKLKGLSIFQLISLFRLIQTLRRSGRFSFNQTQKNNFNNLSVSESYKILNLDEKKKLTKEDINKAYLKIQKKSPFVMRKDFLKARLDYLYLLLTFDFLTLNSFPPFCEVTSGEPVLVIAHLKPIVRSALSSSLNLRAPGDNQ